MFNEMLAFLRNGVRHLVRDDDNIWINFLLKNISDVNKIFGYPIKWTLNTVKWHRELLYLSKHDSVSEM